MDSSKFKKMENSNNRNKKTKFQYKKNKKSSKYYNNKRNNKIKNSKREYIYRGNERRKEKKVFNIKVIGIFIILLIMLFLGFMAMTLLNEVKVSNLPGDAVFLSPSEFDFKPDAYYFDNSLYGNFIGSNENTTESYYLTKNQVYTLAYYSNNTFYYPDGIYVTYKKESEIYNDINVVRDLYFENGTQMILPEGFDEATFIENSKKIASNTKYCTKTFGYTGDDYYKIN